MRHRFIRTVLITALALSAAPPVSAQSDAPALDAGPRVFATFEQAQLKVSLLASGLAHPFGLAFIPGTATASDPLGDILFTERHLGTLRLYTRGELRREPLIDLTQVFPLEQLFDIVLHPDFPANGLVYFNYQKRGAHPDGSDSHWSTTALARGRYDGQRLVDLEELYEADAWRDNSDGAAARLHFLADRTLLLGVSHRFDPDGPQDPGTDIGKILRLNDDGSAPRDNPFLSAAGTRPGLYALGIRSLTGFAVHPGTDGIWALENGSQGGDEVNILRPAANYGWPIATFGRDDDGNRIAPTPWIAGTESPFLQWAPSITAGGMVFYTGDRFPGWKNNLFVTAMQMGNMPDTGHLQRVVLNARGEELRRERLLTDLKLRIRHVAQGPDDLLYLLTDHRDGVLLRLEPATAAEAELYGERRAVTSTAPSDEALAFDGFDCLACHRSDVALLGPSYRDIAARYPLTDANLTLLAEKIIQGGSGEWGDSPMSPHPQIDLATAREMVRQILLLR